MPIHSGLHGGRRLGYRAAQWHLTDAFTGASKTVPRVWVDRGSPGPARGCVDVYRWLAGRPARHHRAGDSSHRVSHCAGGVLAALYAIDTTGGPLAGRHSFFRGGPLSTYDTETKEAIGELADEIDAEAATQVWEAALAATWNRRPVWVHGDVAPSNLLVVDGRLSVVIDFGCSSVGDSACDTVIAWTFLFGSSREAFRAHFL